MDGQYFSVSGQVATYTSQKKAIKGAAYSIGCVITGSFNVDVKAQTSLDGDNWGDILDGAGATAEVLGLTDATEIVQFDINVGKHRFSRLVITYNSGTFAATGFLR